MLRRILFLFPFMLTAYAADISGTWRFEVDTKVGSGLSTIIFQQKGETLTGTYTGSLGEAKVNGTVKGKAVEFQFKVDMAGTPMTVTYKGTVESATSMKGTAKPGDLGEGTWRARKEK